MLICLLIFLIFILYNEKSSVHVFVEVPLCVWHENVMVIYLHTGTALQWNQSQARPEKLPHLSYTHLFTFNGEG